MKSDVRSHPQEWKGVRFAVTRVFTEDNSTVDSTAFAVCVDVLFAGSGLLWPYGVGSGYGVSPAVFKMGEHWRHGLVVLADFRLCGGRSWAVSQAGVLGGGDWRKRGGFRCRHHFYRLPFNSGTDGGVMVLSQRTREGDRTGYWRDCGSGRLSGVSVSAFFIWGELARSEIMPHSGSRATVGLLKVFRLAGEQTWGNGFHPCIS